MIADVILVLWLIMAGILGWKRKVVLEFNSLVILLVSYALARIVAMNMALSLAPSMHFGKTVLGPVGTDVVVSFGLFILLYALLTFVWKKVRPAEDQAGIRIEVDAQGEPIVRGAKLQAFFGMVFGIVRGGLMYLAVLLWLTLLVPITSYKDGRGLTVVHPKSYSTKAIRKFDPTMQAIEWSVRGMRSLQHIRRSASARRAAHKNPTLKTALKSPEFRKLRSHVKMLKRANSKKQGRRDSTLLLWMQEFQQVVTTPSTHKALKQLAQVAPAPFDVKRDSKQANKASKRSKPIHIRSKRRKR